MRTEERVSPPWLYYKNLHAGTYSSGKLHAALTIENFDRHHQRIYNILKKAVDDGIIPSFKMLNHGDSETLKKALEGAATIDENPHVRLYNNPFTIYLFEESNIPQLYDLCRQLEFAFSDTPAIDQTHLSIADLPLTPHISYRQENTGSDYIAIATATPEQLDALKVRGEHSHDYIALKNLVSAQESQHERDAAMVSDQIENDIHGFYNKNYNYFSGELKSTDIQKQVHAACALLQIEPAELLKLKTEAEWLSIINKKYRQISLKYHPDKIGSIKLASTVTRASELFNLINIAKIILNEVAKDPAVLDEKKILEQTPYIPSYQFELRDGFIKEPDYYVNLARNTLYAHLYKNWEFVNTEVRLITDDSQSVTIYKPQLQVFSKDERKQIRVPGYEAFYLLFMSGALPFDQGTWTRRFYPDDLASIFHTSDGSYSNAQKWLLEKALTTSKFVHFLNEEDRFHLAVSATEQGIVNIGRNATEVFQYYYLHFPEILGEYAKTGITHVFAMSDFDKDQAINFVLAHPENLTKLEESAGFGGLATLMGMDPRIMHYALEDKAICKSHHFYEKFILPSISEKIADKFDLVILRQLFYGNSSLIAFLSQEKIEKIIRIFDDNTILPRWLKEDFLSELSVKQENKDIVSDMSAIHFFWLHEQPINPIEYIKQQFIASPDIVYFLNKDALILLASEPEIHWSDYLPISEALLNLGEEEAARRYLNKIANECAIPITQNTTIPVLIQEIRENFENNPVVKNHRDEKITQLLTAYKEILYSDKSDGLGEIRVHLTVLEALNSANTLDDEYFNFQRNKFYDLVDKLKSGDSSDEIRDELLNIKKQLIKISHGPIDKFNHFIEYGRNNMPRFSVASDLYVAMEKITKNYIEPPKHLREEIFTFGINLEGDILESLEKLFRIYQCLGAEEKFYYDFGCNAAGDSKVAIENKKMFQGVISFEKEKIASRLLKFADNEFAVHIQGKRESEHYKGGGFSAKQFESIYALFEGLGQQEHFNKLLLPAFNQLRELERVYKPETGRYEADKKEAEMKRPLAKYIAIRQKTTQKDPDLENMAVHYELHRIIEKNYGALKEKGLLDRDNNRAVKFYRDTLRYKKGEASELAIKEMLSSVRDFLKHYSNTDLYNHLIADFKKSHILCDYLQMLDMDITPTTVKLIAMRMQTLPSVVASSGAALTIDQSTDAESRKAITNQAAFFQSSPEQPSSKPKAFTLSELETKYRQNVKGYSGRVKDIFKEGQTPEGAIREMQAQVLLEKKTSGASYETLKQIDKLPPSAQPSTGLKK